METYIVWIVILIAVGFVAHDVIHGIKLRRYQAKCKHMHTRRFSNTFVCLDCSARSYGSSKKKPGDSNGQ